MNKSQQTIRPLDVDEYKFLLFFYKEENFFSDIEQLTLIARYSAIAKNLKVSKYFSLLFKERRKRETSN